MIDEKFMEDCIEECPSAFLGRDVVILDRQAKLGGFRPDIICSYQHETWIVEIQQRALDRAHLYKCLEYRDLFKQKDSQADVKIILICNSIEEKYISLAQTHDVRVITIGREQFIEIASKFCPKAISEFLKSKDKNEGQPGRIESWTKLHFRPLGWSEHFSLVGIIAHISAECARNDVKLETLQNGKYETIMYEVRSLLSRDWEYSLSAIVSPENWNIDKLLAKPKGWQPEYIENIQRIRKPAIRVRAFVTSQDNLSIVWYPKTDGYTDKPYDVGDWVRWPGEDRYGWSRPSNELLYVKEVDRIRPGDNRSRANSEACNWDVVDELFIALLKAAYDWLCATLSAVVEVEKTTDFEFTLADPSPNDFADDKYNICSPKRIVGWNIFDVESRKWEIEAEWFSNFEKQYGVTLNRIVDTYNTCLERGRNRVASNRAKHISVELQKEGINLTSTKVSEIITRVRGHRYHHHYSSMLRD